MKNIGLFVSEKFQFLEVKLSIYLNRSVFIMRSKNPGMLHKASVTERFAVQRYVPKSALWRFVTVFGAD